MPRDYQARGVDQKGKRPGQCWPHKRENSVPKRTTLQNTVQLMQWHAQIWWNHGTSEDRFTAKVIEEVEAHNLCSRDNEAERGQLGAPSAKPWVQETASNRQDALRSGCAKLLGTQA